MNRERHIALREGHQHSDAEAFFAARSDLGTDQHRMLFEQGYKRGFDAGTDAGAAEKIASDTLLTDIVARDGGINIGLEGGACTLLAEAFATQFRDSGAENYLEIAFTSKEILPGERFVVTLQRVGGKTPAEKRHEVEAERDELREQLAKADACTALARRERDFVQQVATRRSDRLEAAGLHSDCTQEEATALCQELESLKRPAFDDIAGLREMAKHAHRALNAAAGILATVDEDTIGEESVEDVRKRCAEIACSLFSLIRGSEVDRFESAAIPIAPVAKIIMKDGEIVKAATYMPGLPDGEHELYAGPDGSAP